MANFSVAIHAFQYHGDGFTDPLDSMPLDRGIQ